MLRGVDTDKESLGIEVIIRVGSSGNFMGDEHTAAHAVKIRCQNSRILVTMKISQKMEVR